MAYRRNSNSGRNSNGSYSSNSNSNQGDWNAPIHCRKFVCRTCKCRTYPDCCYNADDEDSEMCEDCMDYEWGRHKATRDMYTLSANPLYDPQRCGISRPLHNFNNRMVARGGNAQAAMANLALTNAQANNLQQKRSRLREIGRWLSPLGGRLSQRGRRILAAMTEHQYSPEGAVFRGLRQRYAGSGLGRLENMTLANRLRQMRNSRLRSRNRRRSPNLNNVPLANRRRVPNLNNVPLANRIRRNANSRNRRRN